MRILYVDSQTGPRQAIARAMRSEYDVQEAGTATDGMRLITENKFDLVVTESLLPDRSGPEFVREIKRHASQSIVLAYTERRDEWTVSELVRAGVDGCVSKHTDVDVFMAHVRAVLQHRQAFSADISTAMVRAMHRKDGDSGTIGIVGGLSERERQVLRLLALGNSAKEVASQLSISVKTVETHRARLCAKVGTHAVADLTRLAIRSGLVDA